MSNIQSQVMSDFKQTQNNHTDDFYDSLKNLNSGDIEIE